jgi:orotate phosphoribosyltransferase
LIVRSQLEGSPIRGFIVRKEAKGHGRGRLIEGNLQKGDKVVILEDVVTTGGSALQAIAAAEAEGAQVVEVMALVDREEGGREALLAKGYALFALFTASELKAAARARKS